MVACAVVDENVGLVFSWDPRAKAWVRERGPEDATPPPATPIDDGAVQTYFLDAQNGKWNSTILGLKARQLSVDLGDDYRAPKMTGLALAHAPERSSVQAPQLPRKVGLPMMAGVAAAVVLVGAGAFAAQALFAAKDSGDSTVASQPARSAAGTAATAAAAASASASAAPSAPATNGSGAPTPARTAAPPPPPPPTPQTLHLNVKLPNGTQVFYSGPAAATQNSTFLATFSVVLASGQGGNESLTVYLGDPNVPGGSTNALGVKPDANGNYLINIRTFVPRGDQRLSVVYGTTSGIHTLGTIVIQ